ncbi:MAG TPA: Crp/Fnr family transcriptional regulator [Burkholderiales bacterium]
MAQRPEFDRIRALLGKSVHFRDLAEAERDELAALCKLRKLGDNELAGAAGRPQEEMWIVLQGGLRLSTVTASGEEFVYAVLGPGSFYGLGHLLGNAGAIVDARGFGATELASIGGAQFLALLDRHPQLWRHFAGLLVRRLTLAMSVIRDFGVAPLDQRIVRRLLGQAMSGGADIAGSAPVEMRVNQADLSRMLGASRSRVNAELKRMENARLLDIGYRSITLVDLPRLREIAGSEVFAF